MASVVNGATGATISLQLSRRPQWTLRSRYPAFAAGAA
jgi:hypothetical protein